MLTGLVALCAGTMLGEEVKGSLKMPAEWTVFTLGTMEKEPLDAEILKTIPEQITILGKTINAKNVKVEENRLDMVPLFGSLQAGNTACVFLRLDSNVRQTATVGIGADWWFQAWLNGKEILNTLETGNIDWPPHMTNYTKNIDLEKGANILAVKFISGSGSSILTIGGPEELKKVPSGKWRQMGNTAKSRTCFAVPQVEYSTQGINNLAESVIVIARNADAIEVTAASELAAYLGKSTGSKLKIVCEGDEKQASSLIYVGATKYTMKNGIDAGLLSQEQWFMRSVNGNLILTGGSPRGVLYAVYHFLEEVAGVRWWSPWEEFVPVHTTLASGELNLSGEPVFKLRHLNTYDMNMTKEGVEQLWAPRNRINLEMYWHGKPPMRAEYGGGIEYGPPSFVHTESIYYDLMNKRGYLKPEWVALRGGKREMKTKGHATAKQLCFSNPEMRKTFLLLLKENISNTRKMKVPPMIFDVSFNDISSKCECKACAEIANKYGGYDSGLMLEFVNEMADGVKVEYPDIMLSTLAYMNTEPVPEGIVPRGNVVITLCDTTSSYTFPLPRDGRFSQLLEKWSKIAKKIKIWDYHSCFSDYAIPMPFESTFQEDLQLFKKNCVWGVMGEYHDSIFEDMRDLRFWVLAKLYENPYQDMNRLIKDFTDGFYGPGGIFVREYLVELNNAAVQNPGFFLTQSTLEDCKYITPELVLKIQNIFDRAEKASGGSEFFLRRIRHARLAIDKATYIIFPKIQAFYAKNKNDIPIDRKLVAERIRKTVEEQSSLRANNLTPLGEARAEDIKKRFLEFLDEEIVWDACDNIQQTTWAQPAWHPTWFKNEEVGRLDGCTETKLTGTGSIRWKVTKKNVDEKLKECPGLKLIRMNYLHGTNFARNTAVKFHVKCENPNHPSLFAGIKGKYRDIKVLDRGEITNGWKEIIWNLNEEAGQTCTHTYFRLFAPSEEFREGDVLDIYLDNMRLVR